MLSEIVQQGWVHKSFFIPTAIEETNGVIPYGEMYIMIWRCYKQMMNIYAILTL